jgi:hypothetical protein
VVELPTSLLHAKMTCAHKARSVVFLHLSCLAPLLREKRRRRIFKLQLNEFLLLDALPECLGAGHAWHASLRTDIIHIHTQTTRFLFCHSYCLDFSAAERRWVCAQCVYPAHAQHTTNTCTNSLVHRSECRPSYYSHTLGGI